MKAISLLSCILLSILVTLLLSTAAQATEYREVNKEVNATDILNHIKNGDDVNLTDCRIVGELNVSKLKLETVPNPYFYKLVNEEYTKEELINHRLSENLRVIESNITITNSTFENSFDFSNVLFNSATDFSGANFNNSANFSGATFNNSAYFSGANFNNSAYFSGVFYPEIISQIQSI